MGAIEVAMAAEVWTGGGIDVRASKIASPIHHHTSRDGWAARTEGYDAIAVVIM